MHSNKFQAIPRAVKSLSVSGISNDTATLMIRDNKKISRYLYLSD